MVEGLETPGQAVDAQVEEGPAGEIHVRHAVCGAPYLFHVHAEGVVGNDAMNGADSAAFDHSSDLDREWEEACPDCFHEEEILFFGCGDEFLGLRGVGCECLFAKDVFPGEEAEHGVLVVVGVRGGDVDNVHIGIFGQFLVGAVGGGRGGAIAAFEEVTGAGGGRG